MEYANWDLTSIALYGLTSLVLNCPPVWQSWALALGAPDWLKTTLRAADIIHVEQPWQFRWVWDACAGSKPIVLGTQNVEADLFVEDRPHLPRLLARAIRGHIVAQETFAVAHAAKVLAVTEGDARRLAELYGLRLDRIPIIPNGVDCTRFVPASLETRAARKAQLGLSGKTVILFSGSLHYPNIEAANWIVRYSQQLSREDLCFLIVGTVGQALPSALGGSLKITGRVSDTRPFLEAADLAINPMISGGGSNLKQLEYMAMGLPTIATEIGVRGLRFRHGIHGLVATLDEFANVLPSLVAQSEARVRMSAAARELAQTEYGWSGIAERLIGIYDLVLDEANHPAPLEEGTLGGKRPWQS